MPEFKAAPLRATPGHGVIGVDLSRVISRCAESMLKKAEAGEQRLREQDGKWKYEARESIAFLVERRAPGRYRATSVSDVGGEGHGQVWAEAHRIESLETELRFVLGRHYAQRRLCRDYDEARERANRVEIYLDRSFALGSKGETT